MRQRLHQRIFLITCILLAFFMPVFPKILPVIIFFMMANWMASGIYMKTVPRLFSEKWRVMTLSFALLYLFYLAGMLYSSNHDYGWFDLEVKLSLFIFPVIFATSDLNVLTGSWRRIISGSFIAGCIAGALLLLAHTWMVNERFGVPDAFYYTNLSWYFHSSYLAMYYTFATGIALCWLTADYTGRASMATAGLLLLILFLEAMIFLCSSKAGLILLVITQALFVVLLIFKKAGLARIVLVSLVMIAVFAGYSRIFPFAFTRISRADSMVSSAQTVQANPTDGTVARMAIWKVSAGLIRQHFLFGVGTGDVKDVYLEAYQQQQLYPVYRKKLNAHNQYFQTFVTLGVFGFSLMAALLLIPLFRALRKGEYLYVSFLLIFAINILFESMLESQAGVIFYAFFNVLFFTGDGNKQQG